MAASIVMERHRCPVCRKDFATGNIIRDDRTRSEFDRTVSGFSLCASCCEQRDKGFVACVEIDPAQCKDQTLEGVHCTGTVAHIHKTIWGHVLGTAEMTDDELMTKPFVFVTPEFIDTLRKMQQKFH